MRPRSTDITNLAFPYSCIVQKPEDAVEYYEAYKNIGRKYTILDRYDLPARVIQAGLDLTGKKFIKKGTYNMDDTLTVTEKGKAKIEGEGMYATILKAINVKNILNIAVETGYPSGAHIADIWFNANSKDINCIKTDRFQDSVIERCYFTGRTTSKYLVELDDFDGWLLQALRFESFKFGVLFNHTGTGGYAQSGSSRLFHSSFYPWTDDAIMTEVAGTNISRLWFRDCSFLGAAQNSGQMGIKANKSFCWVIDNNFEYCDPSISLGGQKWTIRDNHFSIYGTSYGIYMTGVGGKHIIMNNEWSPHDNAKAIYVDFWAGRYCFIHEPDLTIDDLVFASATDRQESILDIKPDNPSAISVGASVFTYQNLDGWVEQILISGGTVSAIEFSRDGTNWYPTVAPVYLQPLDRVRVTYSSVPTMTKVPICPKSINV